MEQQVHAIRPTYSEPALFASDVVEYEDWYFETYGINDLHKLGHYGQRISVGVLDTGVPQHADLDVRFGEDLRHGYHPTLNEGKFDRDGHSTHVCGIIAAQHNGVGTKGVAPRVSLHVGKVLGDNGSGTLSDIIRGGNRMAEVGVKLLNLSLGFNGKMPEDLSRAIYEWQKSGMFTIAASGNDGKDNHLDNPSKHEEVLAVGSHDIRGLRSSFSDSGEDFFVYGAGERILSTYGRDQYQVQSGTSMASPFITGMLACLYESIISKYERLNVGVVKDLVTGRLKVV